MNRSTPAGVLVFFVVVGAGCSRDLGGAATNADAAAEATVDADGCTGDAPVDCVQTCGSPIPIARVCEAGAWKCPGSYLPQSIAYNNDNCCPSQACVKADGTRVDAMCATGARICPPGSWLPGSGPDAGADATDASTEADGGSDATDANSCTGAAPVDCLQTCALWTAIARVCTAGSWTCPNGYLPAAIARANDNCCPSMACVQADGTRVDATCSAGLRICPAGSWLPGYGPDAGAD
ncbi:MAG TPA: hypothetical protein VN903_25335 [Polyangia bacterium]|nr:hypothetical protein [Polyangia bacterium]